MAGARPRFALKVPLPRPRVLFGAQTLPEDCWVGTTQEEKRSGWDDCGEFQELVGRPSCRPRRCVDSVFALPLSSTGLMTP